MRRSSAPSVAGRAGLDVVSDGEWRRRYFSTVVADRVDGCAYRPIPGRPEFLPVVVGRIAAREPIVTAEAAYLQRHATVRTLVNGNRKLHILGNRKLRTFMRFPWRAAVTSAVGVDRVLGWAAGAQRPEPRPRTSPCPLGPVAITALFPGQGLPAPAMPPWIGEDSDGHASGSCSKVAYPEPADLAWAFVPVIGEELRRLAASGIDVIQLDDPWQGFLKNASEGLGEQHVAQEIDLSVQTINAAVAAVAGPEISLHLCASHAFYAPSAPGHKSFLRALNTLRVHRITLEFATAGAGHLDILGEFPTDKTLGYGAISRANDDADTVTVVVERIERALGFLPPERLTVNPDCGLAPTAKRTSGSTLDDAYDRLSILCAAARAVRETKRWR